MRSSDRLAPRPTRDAPSYTQILEVEQEGLPMMTQQQRGRLLVVLLIVAIVVFQGTNWWASNSADNRAADTAGRLRAALPTMDLVELRTRPDRLMERFPVRSVIEEGRGVRVNVEVSSLWQARCVVGHVGPDGVATTNTFKKGCSG